MAGNGNPWTLVLIGRVVTMDANSTVFEHGAVYIRGNSIAAVVPASDAVPAGFEQSARIETQGTIYPGLIELHNHLSYDALRLWAVPQRYTNRDQWAGIPEYRKLISGPMQVLGKQAQLLPAICRYVECKALVAGVTTTQGIALFSSPTIRRYYHGLVRNVEEPDDPGLPAAASRIPDVIATQADKFEAELEKKHCLLLHLSEGTDADARKHFLALKRNGSWAIRKSLAGIHCVALEPADIQVFASKQGAMVWSPLSNLLLYGQTARVAELKAAGVRIGIGSDWSPSGSKNLLGELKAARLYSAHQQPKLFSDEELVALATRNAAAILGWQTLLGSVEQTKRADLLVLAGVTGDPYANLLEASERDVALVLIAGVPRYGLKPLMHAYAADSEQLTIAGKPRLLNLKDAADPAIGQSTLSDATSALKRALQKLPQLAAELEHPPARLAVGAEAQPQWQLELDETEQTGEQLRPRLPLPGEQALTGPSPLPAAAVDAAAAQPLSQILTPLELDPLTVTDDPHFLDALAAEQNLPSWLAPGLRALYR